MRHVNYYYYYYYYYNDPQKVLLSNDPTIFLNLNSFIYLGKSSHANLGYPNKQKSYKRKIKVAYILPVGSDDMALNCD